METTAEAGVETTATTAGTEEMGVDEPAHAIVSLWKEAMEKLSGVLEGLPEPSAVQSRVKALREHYIQRLLVLDHEREALSEADRDRLDSTVMATLAGLSDEKPYVTYADTCEAYSHAGGDVEFVIQAGPRPRRVTGPLPPWP